MFKPLDRELLRIRASVQERRLPYSRSRGAGRVELGGKSLVDFSSFDYLNLSSNKRVIKAAQQAIERRGISQAASRVVGGTLPEVYSAEKRLASFLGVEASLFFSSRNQALLSLLSALVSEGDFVAFDEGAQAPLTDACHLLDANPIHFLKDRPDSWDAVIDRSTYTPLCFFVDGVSSFSGDVFPLELLNPKVGPDKKLHLIVDESFSVGGVGERGCGAFELASVVFPNVSFVGSFGFGCPGFGGYVAGSSVLVDYLKQTSRAFASESPIPAYIAAAIEESLDVLELEILERKRLVESAHRFRDQLENAGIEAFGGLKAPIVGVSASSFKAAREMASRFESKGFLVEVVGLRTLRRERPILRFVFNSALADSQVESLLALVVESYSRIT